MYIFHNIVTAVNKWTFHIAVIGPSTVPPFPPTISWRAYTPQMFISIPTIDYKIFQVPHSALHDLHEFEAPLRKRNTPSVTARADQAKRARRKWHERLHAFLIQCPSCWKEIIKNQVFKIHFWDEKKQNQYSGPTSPGPFQLLWVHIFGPPYAWKMYVFHNIVTAVNKWTFHIAVIGPSTVPPFPPTISWRAYTPQMFISIPTIDYKIFQVPHSALHDLHEFEAPCESDTSGLTLSIYNSFHVEQKFLKIRFPWYAFEMEKNQNQYSGPTSPGPFQLFWVHIFGPPYAWDV